MIATATPVSSPLFAGPRLIDGQAAPLKFFLVKHLNGLIRLSLRAHLDESEAARSSGGPILHDIHRDHCPRLAEVILKIVFCGSEREVTNK
jgi:hypothetical protein